MILRKPWCLYISSVVPNYSKRFPTNSVKFNIWVQGRIQTMPQLPLCLYPVALDNVPDTMKSNDLMKVPTPMENPRRQYGKQKWKFSHCGSTPNSTQIDLVRMQWQWTQAICTSTQKRKLRLRCFSKALFFCVIRTPLEMARMEIINEQWRENHTAFLLTIKHNIEISNVAGVIFVQQVLSQFLDLSYPLVSQTNHNLWNVNHCFSELLQISMFALCLK